MTEGDKKQSKFQVGVDPFESIPDLEVKTVMGVPYVFQHITGTALKNIQKRCRAPRSGELDQSRFLKELCDAVVLGIAENDSEGMATKPFTPIPGTKFDPAVEKDVVSNAMEEELMTFLFP